MFAGAEYFPPEYAHGYENSLRLNGIRTEKTPVEGKGKQIFYPAHFIDPRCAIKQDAQRLVVAVLHFEHDLAAGSAGRDRLWKKLAVGASGSYGQRAHGLVGVARVGIEEGGTFGTQPRGIGGILLIAAAEQRAVGQPNGCAHRKVGVGGITAEGGLTRRFDELGIGSTQLVDGVQTIGNGKANLFHGSMGVFIVIVIQNSVIVIQI